MKNRTENIHIRLTKEQMDKLKQLAEQDRRKKTEVIAIALDNYYNLRKV